MVLIHVSRSTEEFIYETKCSASVDVVTREISELHNLRLRVKRIVGGVRELAKHGVMRPEEQRGLDEEHMAGLGNPEAASASASASAAAASSVPAAMQPSGGGVVSKDPIGQRVGVAPSAQLAGTLNECAAAADEAVSNAHAKLRRPLSIPRIHETLQNIKGAVMMSYPQGLPEWDPVRLGLEDAENLQGTEDSKQVLDPASSVLWFAGKAMDRDQALSKYVGQNEKVTIKARVEPRGGQAPQREPAVDEETRRAMMAMHRKREQEQQQLEQADEDSYLNSAWANPRGFKQSVLGMGDIKWRPGQR